MHVVHLIAAEGDSIDDAQACAEQGIESYGNGDVWDWYVLGGRWSGYFGEQYDDVLNFLEDPALFKKSVDDAIANRNRFFSEEMRHLSGRPHTSPDEFDDSVLGLPINDKQAYMERRNEGYAKEAVCFKKLLECDTIEEYHSWCSTMEKEGIYGRLLGHRIYKVGKLVAGYYNFDSMFYDSVAGDCGTEYLWERCEKEPSLQYLFVFDLHN